MTNSGLALGFGAFIAICGMVNLLFDHQGGRISAGLTIVLGAAIMVRALVSGKRKPNA